MLRLRASLCGLAEVRDLPLVTRRFGGFVRLTKTSITVDANEFCKSGMLD